MGTSGWHYEHWRGRFYPESLAKSKWLEFYARYFPTVEVNNTFYRLPSEQAFAAWKQAAPTNFVFAVKASRFITHIKRLRGADGVVENFVSRATTLGDKLGPILYQTPPQMARDEGLLEAFLVSLPKGMQQAFEFRHHSWFEDRVFDLLKRYSVALCVYDMPGFTSPVLATTEYSYFRFHGSARLYGSKYSDDDLRRWAERIRSLRVVKRAYAYFNNDASAYAVENARSLSAFLNE
ncbi:MAG: DUF72 domain-containing protein [Chloroflexi bacterium]|nr:DUF72 domain-containing protein [Chloroflexota bacterium]